MGFPWPWRRSGPCCDQAEQIAGLIQRAADDRRTIAGLRAELNAKDARLNAVRSAIVRTTLAGRAGGDADQTDAGLSAAFKDAAEHVRLGRLTLNSLGRGPHVTCERYWLLGIHEQVCQNCANRLTTPPEENRAHPNPLV